MKVFVMLLVCVFVPFSDCLAEESVECEVFSKKIIATHYKSYQKKDIKELDEYLFRPYYVKKYKNMDPSKICNDFDGNGLVDVAMLIIKKTSRL